MASAAASPLDRTTTGSSDDIDRIRERVNERLANPLAGYTHEELASMGEEFARRYIARPYDDDIAAFRLGAVCAQDPTRSDSVAGLSDRDRDILREEFTNRWKQPRLLYLLIVVCSICATVQGMGQWYSVKQYEAYHSPFRPPLTLRPSAW
jgi:hypothetical protein